MLPFHAYGIARPATTAREQAMGMRSTTKPMRNAARPHGNTLWRRACFVAACALAGAAVSIAAQTLPPLVLPSALAFDGQGNLYIADTGNHVVREISASAAATVVAGTGVQGSAGDNGPAAAAELDSPAGLAVDAAGNIYIADSHSHRIRQIAAGTGMISTIAGTGAAGFTGDGGPAKAAALDRPTALALGSGGDLYVADTNNHRIRRIAAGTQVITTVAGDGIEGFAGDNGPATAASIDSPSGLALDAAGDLYLADTHNGRVREVNAATGTIATVAGAQGLALPRGLALDAAGNILVADSANHRILRISPTGALTTVAGDGTQAFAGDGGPATAASLDSPRAVAVSPAGLPTLADTGNQRVRQVDALPAPGPDIHTVPWVDSSLSTTLALSGPSVDVYGSGSVMASVSAGTRATGTVTLSDTSNGPPVVLGAATLGSAGTATYSTGALAAGPHSLVATYAGDATHASATSPALALTITPLSVTATPNPVALVYGQTVPALTGVLAGVLVQDAGSVAAAYTSSAGTLSPAGAYPIAARLSGKAAGNYVLTVTAASVTIAEAPYTVTAWASTGNPAAGIPLTLSVQVGSTMAGVPTGSVTLLDGTGTLAVVALSNAGGASFTTSSLALGTHALTAVYAGDGNFQAGTSATVNVIVSTASDFSLTAAGSNTQNAPAGSSATFSFSVAMQGAALPSPIVLAVTGVPTGATASLNPSVLVPGGATSFTLTVQTPLARLDGGPGGRGSGTRMWPALLLLPMLWWKRRRTTIRLAAMAVGGFLLAVGLTACGNRVNTGAESANAKIYTLTVTGTATGSAGTAIQHSASVTLEVL